MKRDVYRTTEYEEERRNVVLIFLGSCLVPVVVTALLFSSFIFAETRFVFQSIPFIILTLMFYYTLFRKLFKPPLFSGTLFRHARIFAMSWIAIIILTYIDLGSSQVISSLVIGWIQPQTLGVSQISLSTLIYLVGISIGILKVLFTKKVKIDLPWYSGINFGPIDRNWGLLPNKESMKKGLPLLVRNETDNVITITNVRLETYIDPPRIVPFGLLTRYLQGFWRSPLKREVNIDQGIDLPMNIKGKDAKMLYIPWKNIQEAYNKLSQEMNWHERWCPSTFSIFDEFLLENWCSQPIVLPHILTVFFATKKTERQ